MKLFLGLALASASTFAHAQAQPQAAPPQPAEAPPPVSPRLNPTGRDVNLSAPVRDGPFLLGEVNFILGADDSLRVDGPGLLQVLRPVVDPAKLEELATTLPQSGFVPAARFAEAGLPIRYDAENISLIVEIPPALRSRRQIQLQRFGDERVGELDHPAGVSGYVNFRSFTDYNWSGPAQGFRAPSALVDGAIRVDDFVLESEGTLSFAKSQRTFEREGTRLVYDDRDNLVRWTAGDLQPISRGFVAPSQMAGLSVMRLYSILDPQRNVQPRGDRSFTLTRPSTVEAYINGEPIRRIRLDPGTYNVRDFPFVQGSNDVQLLIEDDAGGKQTIEFSLFFDRTLLAKGLSEFGGFAGIDSRFINGTRHYNTDEPSANGFFRHGFSDSFTGGLNFNVNKHGALVGGEAVLATPIGTLGGDLALSHVEGIGSGYAFNISLLRSFGGRSLNGRSFAVTVEHRSVNFANPTENFADNRFSWDMSATFSQAIGELHFISLSGQYSIARKPFQDEKSARLTYGFRISPRINLQVDGIYEDRNTFGHDYGVRARLIFRLGRRSTATAEYDSRLERGRVGVETSHGYGVGAWSASATADVGKDDVALDGAATYTANRADIGLSHTTLFDISGRNVDSQRTSFRFGTAIAFANGSFAISRPIYDSFVMVKPHSTLNGASVYIEPREDEYVAKSGLLGPAVDPYISAYTERVVTFDVPKAPVGYDLGPGNVRIYPPYRSGYLVTAGSDYSITALGTLVDQSGNPVSLLAGRAIELAAPDRTPVTVFTNRAGRFGLSGLRPGRWRIEMPTDPAQSVIIEVPEKAQGVVRLGEVKLGESK